MKMLPKAQIEVRSVKKNRVTVQSSVVDDVTTADFINVTPNIRVLNSIIKSITVKQQNVDIRNINRILREPEAPLPDVTRAVESASTE
jgi:hypothetical protein